MQVASQSMDVLGVGHRNQKHAKIMHTAYVADVYKPVTADTTNPSEALLGLL